MSECLPGARSRGTPNFRHFFRCTCDAWGAVNRGQGSMRALILRGGAAASVVVLAVLSWLPGQDMVRSGILSPSEEHFFAYLISGALVAAAVPRYRFLHVACFYALLAVVLELGQNIAPGRNAEAFTALVSMSGAVAGEIVARLATGAWRDRYGFPRLLTGPPSAGADLQLYPVRHRRTEAHVLNLFPGSTWGAVKPLRNLLRPAVLTWRRNVFLREALVQLDTGMWKNADRPQSNNRPNSLEFAEATDD